ncbi:MAG: hypothetical protein AAGJ10_09035 [Bacteroidota bacterium]
MATHSTVRLAFLTTAAMLAFAANVLLGREALASGHMGAASFTTVRVCAGAVALGGALLLNEAITMRLGLTSIVVLGGILPFMLTKREA